MKHIIIRCVNIENVSRLMPLLLSEDGYDIIDVFADGNEIVSKYCQTLAKHYSRSIKFHEKEDIDFMRNKEHVAVDGDYYIYIDENVAFIERGTLNKLFKTKEKNEQYFLTTPLTVNHWLGCYLLQNNENFKLNTEVQYQYDESFDGNDFIYTNGEEAERIHISFIEYLQKEDGLDIAHCPNFECCTRFPMVCICWAGSDMAKLLDEYDTFNDEPFLTFQYPAKMGMKNLVVGSKIIANYAYGPQKEYLDKTDILSRYIYMNGKTGDKNYMSFVKWCNSLRPDIIDINDTNFALYRLSEDSKDNESITDKFRKRLTINSNKIKRKRKKSEMFDNEGDNISELYPYYGNLTGIYWVMKHLPKTIEYVGIETERNKWLISMDDISRGLAVYDIIVPNQITKNNISATYKNSHSSVDFLVLEGIIKMDFPEYYTTWLNIMNNDEQMGFIKNCVITKRDTFLDMWKFIFKVLDAFRKTFNLKTGDSILKHVQAFSVNSAPTEMDGDWITYQSKMFEYMAERLVTLYIYKNYTQLGMGNFAIS